MAVGSLVIEYLVKDSTSMNLGLCYESVFTIFVHCVSRNMPNVRQSLVLFETIVFDAVPNFCFLTYFNRHSLDISFPFDLVL